MQSEIAAACHHSGSTIPTPSSCQQQQHVVGPGRLLVVKSNCSAQRRRDSDLKRGCAHQRQQLCVLLGGAELGRQLGQLLLQQITEQRRTRRVGEHAHGARREGGAGRVGALVRPTLRPSRCEGGLRRTQGGGGTRGVSCRLAYTVQRPSMSAPPRVSCAPCVLRRLKGMHHQARQGLNCHSPPTWVTPPYMNTPPPLE